MEISGSFLPGLRGGLEAGLALEPWQYRWSNARAYALGATDDLLAPNSYYEELGATAASRRQKWREFLLGAKAREEAIRQGQGVMGDESFRKRVWQAHGRPTPRGRGRPRPRKIADSEVQISSQPVREEKVM